MYFENIGKLNTEKTIEYALKAAEQQSIKNIVFASSTGYTANFLKDLHSYNRVCVKYAYGFKKSGKNLMDDSVDQQIRKSGIKVLSTSHILSGAERGLSNKFGGIYPVEIIAHTLRMFGQGVKVCVEISVMALDAGLIPFGEPIVAIGGTGRGADTAIIIKPAHANNILDTKIMEIICKPKYGF
ncbi:MAG: pyruvate kinase alpha/beta domain-containing protein [Clostridia bacterium]|nr:pyruvate kinase alpha/beta domain-containing protein [Clostridia bacterium]